MSAHASVVLTLDGPLAVVTLSRAPVNAIDEEWLARLDAALATIERAEGVAALLVRSAERIFSAGADLELMRSRFDTPAGRQRMVAFVREIQRVYARLEQGVDGYEMEVEATAALLAGDATQERVRQFLARKR
jgi:enoyl-CoA hydratase/carnithine racemase